MAYSRSIDCSSAMPELRRDRTPHTGHSPMAETARLLGNGNEACVEPMVGGSVYDRSAIMKALSPKPAICAPAAPRTPGPS
jgi:hypothetical protein